MGVSKHLIWYALVIVTACREPSPAAPEEPVAAADAGPGKSAAALDAGGGHVASDALRRCAARGSELSSVGTLSTLAARMGELPRPVDGPCLIATLPRPLTVVATKSVSSAQPAGGPKSPRIFFLLPGLVIGAVPDGAGSAALEVGEWVEPTRTIKAEIPLPVDGPLAVDAPLTRILVNSNGTVCATCHREEAPHPSRASAFVSAALRPRSDELVSIATLRDLHTECVASGDAGGRCAMLHAVFDFGEVTAGAFSDDVATLY